MLPTWWKLFALLFYLGFFWSVDFGVSELKWHGSADTNYTPTGQSDTRHVGIMTPVMTPWRDCSAQIHMQSATSTQRGTYIASVQGDILHTIAHWSYVEPSRPEQGPVKLQTPSDLLTKGVAHLVWHFIAVVPQASMYDLTQWGCWKPDNRGDTCDRRWVETMTPWHVITGKWPAPTVLLMAWSMMQQANTVSVYKC